MPVVAQAELLAGVELAVSEPRQQELRTLSAQVIAMAADILPVTSEVAEQFAHIFVNLRRKGRPIDTNDIWIAAIARVHNLVVVTNDDHFQQIGHRELARTALVTPIDLYRALEMAFRLPQAEAALTQVQ